MAEKAVVVVAEVEGVVVLHNHSHGVSGVSSGSLGGGSSGGTRGGRGGVCSNSDQS